MEKSFDDCVIEGTLPEYENIRIYKENNIFENNIVTFVTFMHRKDIHKFFS